ncbi:MAG: hypothetical protein P4L46_00155 [Fimbriimonas sp.]|nr:hypothetical protein [Fimbriimonas sp.]
MATMFAMGNLIGDHISAIATTPTLALPAVLVDLLALVTIILASRQLHMIATLDYSKPTSEALRLVAALRNLRARSTQYLFLICLPLWSVFPIVLGQALFGFNFIRSVNWPWLISNVMFGIAVAIALAVAARKLADRSEVLERIDDAIAGAGLARARELLLQVKTLESEA